MKIEAFKRNRYYYGKLLSVRDFENEQNYFNQKRFMINKEVNGSGIVSGMQVKSEEGRIIVKSGIAIDKLGREIVISDDVVVDTEKINKNKFESDKDIYLCVSYCDDKEEEVSRLVEKCYACEEVYENSYIKEGYKFSFEQKLKDNNDENEIEKYGFTKIILSEESDCQIYATAPKWIAPDESIELIIGLKSNEHIKKGLVDEFYVSGENILIRDEKTLNMAEGYRKSFIIKPITGFSETNVKLEILRKKGEDDSVVGKINVGITLKSISDIISMGHFEDRKLLGNDEKDSFVYLAKIIFDDNKYIVENLDGEYVYSNKLLYNLIKQTGKRIGPMGEKGEVGVLSATAKLDLVNGKESKVEVEYNQVDKNIHFDFSLSNSRMASTVTGRIGIDYFKDYDQVLVDTKLGKVPLSVRVGLNRWNGVIYDDKIADVLITYPYDGTFRLILNNDEVENVSNRMGKFKDEPSDKNKPLINRPDKNITIKNPLRFITSIVWCAVPMANIEAKVEGEKFNTEEEEIIKPRPPVIPKPEIEVELPKPPVIHKPVIEPITPKPTIIPRPDIDPIIHDPILDVPPKIDVDPIKKPVKRDRKVKSDEGEE